MAKVTSKCLFLLFLVVLTTSSSGTLVGFSYNAKETATTSLGRYVSFLKLNNVSESHIRVFEADHRVMSMLSNSGVSVDLSLNESVVKNLSNPESSANLWLKTQLVTFLPHVNIKSITVNGSNDLPRVLSTMKSVQSILTNFHLDNEVKVSVAFSLSFLESLNTNDKKHLQRIFGHLKRTGSFVILEASVDTDPKLGLGDPFIESMIQKAAVAASLLPCDDVPVVMRLRSLVVPSEIEVSEFEHRVLESTARSQIVGQFAELYVEVEASSRENFAQKELNREHEEIFLSSRRELSNNLKTTIHDDMNPPATDFPTNPVTTPPVTLPPNTPTPTVITVPATNPVSTTPANPASTPMPIPTTTPVTVPPENPSTYPPVPVTNPVTTPAPITVPGAQPVTNPVTTYPAPAGNVPGTTPVTNPVTPPATTNAPAIPGQSWCVARSGSPDTALQSALDYACGMGGADCSQIQQGGSCYNPNTLQNHASFAFNSYYQKNPVATSCDFGGTAAVVNVNPSTGSCIFPSSSSSSSTTPVPTPTTSSTNPATTPSSPNLPTNPAAIPSSPGAGISINPPSVLNQSNPGSAYGSDIPPADTTSTSNSAALQPFIGTIIVLTCFSIRMTILDF
ncbi:hypothetical protein Tsubulata_046578 [Turnera subulata]|uniref:glucan endo-1,3-beta-D-glucosidase n=1 Tax=Turnera subulata TaxID=218843 RepID=A0A9Q0F7I9_9ROSI|nr:hypothetical protein Tsubulata_046578 [Turnera subulata]